MDPSDCHLILIIKPADDRNELAIYQEVICTMELRILVSNKHPSKTFYHSLEELKKSTCTLAFFNLFLVAAVGVVLRTYPLLPISFPAYKNLLHAHSHFAFGGWVMPILFVLIIKYFSELANSIAFRHLKNIAVLFLFSAYGMLLSFPFRGYAAVSIGFSTLSILASFYMAVVFWKASTRVHNPVSIRFLKAGLVFLVVSSIGPFATAPLIALGKTGTPIYYNAIYFYLHFQYNGWFTFAILALLYKMLERKNLGAHGKLVYSLFTFGCVPAYFLSTLWNHPPAVFYIIALIAAILQVIATVFLLKDIRQLKWKKKYIGRIFKTAILFFVLKTFLQLLSASPGIASIAYTHRNFIIAYLHMVLLGFISAFALAAILKGNEFFITPSMKKGILLFCISFLSTEILLVLNASGINIALAGLTYSQLLLLFSLFFPIGCLLIWNSSRKLFVFQVKQVLDRPIL